MKRLIRKFRGLFRYGLAPIDLMVVIAILSTLAIIVVPIIDWCASR